MKKLVQSRIPSKDRYLWYAEKDNKKTLLSFTLIQNARILRDGSYIVKNAVTDILYTEVEGYKDMIVYDHCKNKYLYTDKEEDIKRSETCYVLPVINAPNGIVEDVINSILKKDKNRSK